MVAKDTRVSLKIDAETRDMIKEQAAIEGRTFIGLLRDMVKERASK